MKKQYIKREIEPVFRKYLKQFSVVALTGARQTGKTTMLKELLGDKYEFISLDDLNIRGLAKTDPKLFIDNIKGKAIIDEIQYAPELLSYIKLKVDSDRAKKGWFVVTGSQQFLMMKDLSETLAGRIGILNLQPFSYSEIASKKIDSTKTAFVHFALKGAFPELNTDSQIDSSLWYANYIQTYLERDLKIVYNIGNLREFNSFIKILASRAGQLLNMSSLAADVGVAVNTIKKWISILQAGNIIYILNPYYSNISKRFIKMPKAYFTDIGMVCHLNGIRNSKQLFNSPLLGQIFENFCTMEIVKTLQNRQLQKSVYFLRTNKSIEMDMLIEKGNKFIQVDFKAVMTVKNKYAENFVKILEGFKKPEVDSSYLVSINDTNSAIHKKVKACGLIEMVTEII